MGQSCLAQEQELREVALRAGWQSANLKPGNGAAAASEAARSFAKGLRAMVEELETAGLSLNAIARRFNDDGICSRRCRCPRR